MKNKIGLLIGLIVLFAPVGGLKADGGAIFSVTSTKTHYSVGDDITVSFSVDAGPYATTLNVIDMQKIVIDNPSVIEPKDLSNPFTPGSVYSNVALQSYSDGLVHVVVYVNPESKPSSRSGLIGTITFKALKEGRVTIYCDEIEAAEENNITEFVETSASSLTLEVGSGGSSASSSSGATATSGSTMSGVSSSPKAGVSSLDGTTSTTTTPVTTTTVSTGPEHIALAIILSGLVFYFGFVWYKSNRYYPKI